MGRARDLADGATGGTLVPRVETLETHAGTTDTAIASLVSSLSGVNSSLASLDARLDALSGLGTVFQSTAEQYTLMPVNGAQLSLYSIAITDMKIGDIVILMGQFEVTNDLSYTVGVGRRIIRGANNGASGGNIIQPATSAMDNVDPSILHHKVINATAAEVCPVNGSAWYNMAGWAVSTGGSGNLTIEQGYGKLVMVRIRNPVAT